MYGLLLDTIQKFIREKYGESYWANIRRRAKLSNHWFVTHEVYPESVIPSLVDAAAEELGEDSDNVMAMFGEYFAENIGRYGYARLLRVLGRELRDFLNGLVDLHEYLRFSYPNMNPPAFFCSNETPEGLHLHYLTKREGFLCYVIGQMKTIGRIYGKQLDITIISTEEIEDGEVYTVFDLKFDNRAMLDPNPACVVGFADFNIDSETFFSIFPFSFVFSKDLVICKVGSKLQEVLPGLLAKELASVFTLCKPYMAKLDWDTITLRTNCTYELHSVQQVHRKRQEQGGDSTPDQAPRLKLKGQMMHLDDVQYIAFLCSPAMDSPEDLYETGIFISDLSLHNFSREFIMAGSQKHPELNIAFSQEKIRSAQLETSIKKTDELLYQMIPKSIADKLRNGQPPLDTCQEFDSVSILFSDIVSFTPMCSRLQPMQVVCVLNKMCMAYDKLCERHNVYKVEMIGDAYMVLAGGPIPSQHHAENITNYGLGILEATASIIDPSTADHLKIRVGIHSGGVVAGVVGATTQRYDVFGDTVNIAARMESTGEPMRIQVSEATASLLIEKDFIIVDRGQVEVKGKGLMKTFWVDGKKPYATPGSRPKASSLTVNRVQLHPPIITGGNHNTVPSTPTGHHALRHRRGSPAPDEWPQAELRLGDHYYLKTHRSHTLPSIDTSSVEHELRSILCPFDHTNYGGGVPGVGMHPSTPLLPHSQARESPPAHNSPVHQLGTSFNASNLTQIRQSLVQGLATISEGDGDNLDVAELLELATIAEENARSARRLADAASQLVRRRCTRQGQRSPEWSSSGSSVDPPSCTNPSRQDHYNYCNIL